LKIQCENCSTVWTIHKLGNIPAREGFLRTEAQRCIGEYCPGCMARLDVREGSEYYEIPHTTLNLHTF